MTANGLLPALAMAAPGRPDNALTNPMLARHATKIPLFALKLAVRCNAWNALMAKAVARIFQAPAVPCNGALLITLAFHKFITEHMKLITKFKPKLFILCLIAGSLMANMALAAGTTGMDRLKNTATAIGFSTEAIQPQTVAMQIVLAALGFVGLIFLIMIIYAGYQWMTAGGNEEKVKEAKKRIQYAIIGIVVILAAFAITTYIANVMIKSTTPGYYSY